MNHESPVDLPQENASKKTPSWRNYVRQGENLIMAFVLAGLMILPLLEIVLRQFHTGISGSTSIVQDLVLVTSMLGGAIAARENRLLALSSLKPLLKGRLKSGATILSSSFAAAVSAILCGASWKFFLTEKASGKVMAYGIPVWPLELILPLGFGLVALRLILNVESNWQGKLAVFLLAALFLFVGLEPPTGPENLFIPALALLLLATICGAPIFTFLGGLGILFFWTSGFPVATIPLKHYSLVTNATLPMLPLFTLAGYLLAEGGASERLVRVFQAWFGHLRGGPALATVIVCAFFTSFTGASGVTILALGGLLMPVLLSAGYSRKNALGLLTGSGSLGLLFPPCLPLIVYAVMSGIVASNLGVAMDIRVEKMFLGGIVPGILMVVLAGWLGVKQGPKLKSSEQSFKSKEAWQAVWQAKWELILPAVALFALFGGFATPVEAAALTAFYAFVIETFVYRDLRVCKDLPRVMSECGLVIGGILLILGVAMGLTHYLVIEQIPDQAVLWVQSNIESRWVFLITLNLFLLVVGCLMDVYSALVIIVPLIVPMGIVYGIDPIHLGIIFLANLELGYLTPPIGMNLFLSSYRFNRPIGEIIRSVIPMLLVLGMGVLLITYLPALTTLLPNLLK